MVKSTTEIRQKLFEYIRLANDKKVKAFYTIIESEIENKPTIWTKEFVKEMDDQLIIKTLKSKDIPRKKFRRGQGNLRKPKVLHEI